MGMVLSNHRIFRNLNRQELWSADIYSKGDIPSVIHLCLHVLYNPHFANVVHIRCDTLHDVDGMSALKTQVSSYRLHVHVAYV